VLKQALLQATGAVLVPAFLPEQLNHGYEEGAIPQREAASESEFETFIQRGLQSGSDNLYSAVHEKLDRILLPLVLRFTEGNQHHAARLLGIARQTLRQKLRDLGLSISHSVQTDETDRD
jgi:DNA-binding protein Fis